MRLLSVLIVAMLIGQPSPIQAGELLTIEEFTNRVASQMVFKRPDIRVSIEPPSTIVVSSAEGNTSRAYTDNIYELYRDSAEDEASIIEHFAFFAIENLDQNNSIDMWRVFPVVKTSIWLYEMTDGMEIKSGETLDAIYSQHLFDELILTFVEDSERGLRYLKTSETLALFGTTAAARRAALQNLQRLLRNVSIEDERKLKRLRLDGTYETSLLLFEELWSDKRLEVVGDVVIALPARGVLLVAGSGDPAALAELRSIASTVGLEHPYRISARLFVRREGKWVRFDQ